MADAKDILGLPKGPLSTSLEKKPNRAHKDSQRKPEGVSREVYALTGGLPLLMATLDVSHLKRRPPSDKEKISWQWLPFTSSARKDNLQLYHWVKVVNGVPPTGDYSFAKYNKSVDIIKYTDDEYDKHLTDPNWTKEETDQLFDLCERFDLRFIVIADRFPFPRSMEELKSRYYAVSRALVIARAPSSGDVSHHPLVKDNYNITQEIERRRALSTVLSHSKQQDNKDAEILAEAKRIVEARLISKGGEGSELPVSASGVSDGTIGKANAPVDSVSPSSNQSPPTAVVTPPALTAETHSTPASLRMLRVYLRTTVLDQMAQAASSSAGLRTIKRVDQTLQELRKFQSAKTPPAQGYRTIVASRGFPAGFWEKAQIILSRSRSSQVNVKPKVPTKAVCAEHLELRKEILALLNLQKQMQYKEAEASAHRDNSYDMAPTPCTPKRSHRGGDQERPFLQDSGGFAGERVGKREHKRKAPGRFSEAPPSPPQTKRARKLKAADG